MTKLLLCEEPRTCRILNLEKQNKAVDIVNTLWLLRPEVNHANLGSGKGDEREHYQWHVRRARRTTTDFMNWQFEACQKHSGRREMFPGAIHGQSPAFWLDVILVVPMFCKKHCTAFRQYVRRVKQNGGSETLRAPPRENFEVTSMRSMVENVPPSIQQGLVTRQGDNCRHVNWHWHHGCLAGRIRAINSKDSPIRRSVLVGTHLIPTHAHPDVVSEY